jgi:hypothetical protein
MNHEEKDILMIFGLTIKFKSNDIGDHQSSLIHRGTCVRNFELEAFTTRSLLITKLEYPHIYELMVETRLM